MRRRVVVTGMGVVSPIGSTVATFTENLLTGVSGVGPITLFDPAALPTRIAAEARWDGPPLADRKIAFALAAGGVAALSVHDLDPAKAVQLAADLQRAHPALPARAGAPRPGDFDLLVNATPAGMRPDDPLPWPVEELRPGTIVGDVTTKPEITPFLAAARERGCAVLAGRDMVEGQLAALFRFFGFDVDPLR